MAAKDYYQILGVDRNATEKEIKSAYRKIAIKYHPDKQAGKSEKEKKEAEDKFKEAAEAYDVLSNPEKKQRFDTYGTADGSWTGTNAPDLSEILRRFHSMSGDFGDFFGRTTSWTDNRDERVFQGNDKVLKIGVTLSELFNGTKKTIKYKIHRKCKHCGGNGLQNGKTSECPHCHGTGRLTQTTRTSFGVYQTITDCRYCNGTGIDQKNMCKHCGGSGLEEVEEQMVVTPPTIDNFGKKFYKRGEGNSCVRNKGENGDLYFTFSLLPDDKFRLDENDPLNIITEVEIPVLDCLTGTKTTIEHLDGKKYSLVIPQCANHGSIYKIVGKGLTTSYGKSGDLMVVVKIKMPLNLRNEDVSIISKLKGSPSFM